MQLPIVASLLGRWALSRLRRTGMMSFIKSNKGWLTVMNDTTTDKWWSRIKRIKTGAYAVALDDMRKSMRDHRKRVKDSHELGMESMNQQVRDRVDDDMGDLIVGDVINNLPTRGGGNSSSKVLAAGIALPALLAAGAAGYLWANQGVGDAAPPETTDTIHKSTLRPDEAP